MADDMDSSSPPNGKNTKTSPPASDRPFQGRPGGSSAAGGVDDPTVPPAGPDGKRDLLQSAAAGRNRRCLCLGGSFNPIHYGHLRTTRAAAERLHFLPPGDSGDSGDSGGDVLLVPSARPPHKPGDADLADAGDRLAMCRLAVASDPSAWPFGVSDAELRRAGPSYTILTIRALLSDGYDAVTWLIGADLLPGLPGWREFDALLAEATLAVMARPGHPIDWPALPPAVRSLRGNVVEVPAVDVSATMIRNRLRRGEPIDGLTPPAVADAIAARGLYRR